MEVDIRIISEKVFHFLNKSGIIAEFASTRDQKCFKEA